MSQENPIAPIIMNADSQPQFFTIHGTTTGARMAPTLVPELNMPVARALSFFGNHSATVLMAAGKFPDSPNPRNPLAIMNPPVLFASACAMAAKDQTTSDNA